MNRNCSQTCDFLQTWRDRAEYFEALKCLASLSKLFSTSSTPFLDYRLAENIFCEYFHAINDARSCTAYDARINTLGIGIKTFIINKKGVSTEKIAEFNKKKPELDPLKGADLAQKLGELRNIRIELADSQYGVSERIYHIVGRSEASLHIFNAPYEKVDLNNIQVVKDNVESLAFTDGVHQYSFNRSKSVLLKQFEIDRDCLTIVPVEIIQNPLVLIKELCGKLASLSHSDSPPLNKGVDYVILPLYGVKKHQRIVFEKSGLNQWNAGGRPRNPDEVYIPIPKKLHHLYPNFFPKKQDEFSKFYLQIPNLSLPEDQRYLLCKVCQQGGKALMSDPNEALGKWILRSVMHKKEGELVTIDDLDDFGIDSVLITKKANVYRPDEDGHPLPVYAISFTNDQYETWTDFIDNAE